MIAVTGGAATGREGIYGIDPATGAVRLLIGKDNNETVFHREWARDGATFYDRHLGARRGIYRLELESMRKTHSGKAAGGIQPPGTHATS